MKKKTAVLLTIILVFCLTACGSNTNDVPIRNTDVLSEGAADSYIGNRVTKKLHVPSCNTLPKEKNRVYFAASEDAIQNGYDPCENCQP